jgi:5-methyltetrahydrofolate--homocysteine methyltransferase
VWDVAADYEAIRKERSGGQSELLPLEAARSNGVAIDFAAEPPVAPASIGTFPFDAWPLEDLVPFIDWTPFFRAWELHGTFPAILEDPVVGEAAQALWADAQAMLGRIVSERWLTAKGVAAIWPARRDGDDILVFPDADRREPLARLPFLRQQVRKSRGRPNDCLADFVSPQADWIGGFAVTTGHGIETKLAEFQAAHDDYSDILLKALADRLAEAFAEALHLHVRRHLWGHEADGPVDYQALIREQYQGIRPAPGYPACPDHSLKPILFDLLDASATTGISLTESFAMLPTAAVSGFYFAHPRARYFGVARVGADQVADYAVRRGVSLDQARAWLRPNLD